MIYVSYSSHKDTILSSAMSQITGEDSRGARIPLTSISTSSDHLAQQNGSILNNMSTPHSNPGKFIYFLDFNYYLFIYFYFFRKL